MIGIAILFIALGILIKYRKMYFLIAGYNTMSKEEKEKYDIDGIARVFRNVMFGMGFLIIIGFLVAKWLENPEIENYSFWTGWFPSFSWYPRSDSPSPGNPLISW